VDRIGPAARLASSATSIVLLVAFNALPLVGVLFWDWDLVTILILYWVENGIIGVVNIAKIGRAEGGMDPRFSVRAANSVGRAALVPFFVLHYGIFWVVHGIFVFLLPLLAGLSEAFEPGGGGLGAGYANVSWSGIALAAVGLAVSHVGAYAYDYIGRGVYRTRSPGAQTFEPYPRLIVLHVTIIVGSWFVIGAGQPVLLVALMVVLKTVMDLALYLFGSRRASAAPPTT
jgi:hypothetical protein